MDFIARSRAQARSVRGTDYSGNDWLLDEGCSQSPTAAAAVPVTSNAADAADSADAYPYPNYTEDFETSSEDGDAHIERARSEWTSARAHEYTRNDEPKRTPVEITPKRGETTGVLSVTVECDFTQRIQDFIKGSGCQQLGYNLSSPEGLDKV